MSVPRQQAGPVFVEIQDPVAGFQYTLDIQNHVAHRVALQVADATPGRVTVAPRVVSAANGGGAQVQDNLHPQASSEALGQQMIEGVMTEGRRTTVTYPAGSRGNDRPIVTTSEQWYSKELRLTVLSRRSDPRSGDSITRFTNISRTEPDPALFQVPPDYTIVDETGPFTIQYTRP
jgi:hypothetical protein